MVRSSVDFSFGTMRCWAG